MPSSTTILADDYFGSVAFSQRTGQSGASWDYSTRAEAQARAVRECGASDCRAVWDSWDGHCAALAVGYEGWGADGGTSRDEAENAAISVCNGHTTNCKIAVSECTRTSTGDRYKICATGFYPSDGRKCTVGSIDVSCPNFYSAVGKTWYSSLREACADARARDDWCGDGLSGCSQRFFSAARRANSTPQPNGAAARPHN